MTQKKILLWLLPLMAIVAFVLIMTKGHGEDNTDVWQHNEGFVFGTVYSITYQHGEDLQAEIEGELKKVDEEFSMFNEKSTVARINRGDSLVQRSAMFQEVYTLAMQVNADTHGAFDITVAPLVNAWGFGFKHEQMPTPQQVDSLLQIRSQMDFAAIAKGYGCDVVARMLERHGIGNYMVEIGGEVALKGVSPRGDKWNVSVDMPQSDPDGTHHESAMTLSLDKGGVATSGNYRKFKEVNGKRISHIVNPKTGKSEESTLLSVTVTAPNCMLADAWATACMAMGTEKAKALMEKENKMGVMTIATTPNGSYEVWSNKAFASQVAR